MEQTGNSFSKQVTDFSKFSHMKHGKSKRETPSCPVLGGRNCHTVEYLTWGFGPLSRSWLCTPAFLAPSHILFLSHWETLLHSSFQAWSFNLQDDASYVSPHNISLDGSRFPFLPLVSWWTSACSHCSVPCSRVMTIRFQKLLPCRIPNQNLTFSWNLVYDS